MHQRLSYNKMASASLEAMIALERSLEDSPIPARLRNLIKLRASQINGCAYCIDMHARDARVTGESERRVHAVAAFEDSPLFDEGEKAALAWAVSLTNLSESHPPNQAWERVRSHFNDRELADLTWLIAAINAWNRISIGFRSEPPAEWPKLPQV
jgi:AhpD family alkylhydroperoxidase